MQLGRLPGIFALPKASDEGGNMDHHPPAEMNKSALDPSTWILLFELKCILISWFRSLYKAEQKSSP